MSSPPPTIEEIEDQLFDSRFQPWDVEVFLANRHQAKIDALAEPKNRVRRHWEVFKQLTLNAWLVVLLAPLVTSGMLWLINGKTLFETINDAQRCEYAVDYDFTANRLPG